MTWLMNIRAFEPFALSHWAALLVTVLSAVVLCRLMRSDVSEATKSAARWSLAVVLFASVLADPVLAWWRYGGQPDEAIKLLVSNALPFYLCDVVALILAVALIQKNQRLAEIGYLWGIAGTVQGLITPTLYFSWDSPEYYAFFAQHGGVPVAAVTLVLGMGLAPEPGVFKRALLSSWAYIVIVFGINGILQTNYGFLNHKPEVPTLFDYMGPWPFYLITLQLVAFSLYGLLIWPFWAKNRKLRVK